MLELFRSFLVVLREGSLNRAAAALHVTQPSLTRQMQSLEAQIGAPLLERQPSGVKPTALGLAMTEQLEPVLERYDAALADLRRNARGQNLDLRIGYLAAAAHAFLIPFTLRNG
jgi:DNA-binding transcriptional LysR family regulator